MLKKIIKLSVLIVCFLGLNTLSVYAESDLFTDEEDLLFADIESVYSASKYDQKVTDAPAKVSIVTSEEIQRYGYRTLDQILGSLAGFYMNYDRNYSYIGIRGFGIPGDYNTRFLVLVDGHRINDNLYDSTSTETGFIIPVDLIDRVEVIRGPSSSLYGSNAFFGVVNVITKKGRDWEGFEVSAGAGTHDTYQGRMTYGKRFQNGFEMLLSGTYYDSDGDDSLYYAEFDDPSTNNGVFKDGDDDNVESFFAKLSFQNFRLETAYVDREKGIPTAPWGVEFNDNDTRTWDKNFYIDLNYQDFHESSNTDILFRLFYDKYEYDGHYVYDYGPPPDIVTNKDDDVGEFWGTEIQLNHVFYESHRVTVGGEYRDSIKQEQKNYDIYGVYLDTDEDIDTWGIFVQDEWSVRDNLILNIGVRHDEYDPGDDSTNPRAAIIYTPVEDTTLKFLYGQAFRTPNAYELYYNDGEETTKSAGSLDSENITSYELIWEQVFNVNIRGSLTAYRNEIEDLIALTLDPADDLFVFDNIGDADAYGVELSLDGQWQNGIKASFNYTYQDNEDDETDARLVNSPRHMVKANMMVPIIDELLGAGLQVQYESGRDTIADDETDNFCITNVTLVSKNLLQGLTLSGSVYNIFDDGYDYPSSEEHEQDTIKQDGRIYWFKADYLF